MSRKSIGKNPRGFKGERSEVLKKEGCEKSGRSEVGAGARKDSGKERQTGCGGAGNRKRQKRGFFGGEKRLTPQPKPGGDYKNYLTRGVKKRGRAKEQWEKDLSSEGRSMKKNEGRKQSITRRSKRLKEEQEGGGIGRPGFRD